MRALDDKDRQILDLLNKDARMPLKTIAGHVGLARSSLRERVSRLEAQGVIKGYRVEIDYAAAEAAPVSAFLLLRLKKTPDYELVARIAAFDEVRRCASLAGEIDILVELSAPQMSGLNAARDRIATLDGVRDATTLLVLDDIC
ncbi:Lrp/AsnC family transcriptional regulator [Pelagibius sp. Alg239-R121]|uniref:Lrp/AsnC family transcriptional regulator n=1 Tax=Pelagibius sp. Alg239-R121 TaxID=2993448 RepID=UPI0024A78A41|nr:Lrp/AsnC family transcriptional regulator [Pelagibius sp. Alg239-R121]